ncbi:MAG: amidase [Bryobacteraceae bacterium]|nr:amidase [Bryobacteraceae bacterium]
MTILEAAAAIRAGDLSPVELTSRCLAGIRELNPRLNACLTVLEEQALRRAKLAEEELASGKDLGLLHGIPIVLKDNFYTKGVRTTCGSKLFADYVPAHDATVTERLRDAGTVLLAKTGLHELAYGITSGNPHFGPVRNPWDPERIPGGSSGGSGAAVASGMVFLGMGSDTGGSIRIPASYCGTVGLKPTFGRVSRHGVFPLGYNLDHMGPMTRSVRDAAVVLQAIAGHDVRDKTSSRAPVADYLSEANRSIAGLRIGLPENHYFERVAPECAAAVESMSKVAEQLGASLVRLPFPDVQALNTVGRVILLAEASAILESRMAERDQFGPDILALLDQGRLLPATDYINAQRLRSVLCAEFSALWSRIDCFFTPATPMAAPRIGQSKVMFDGEEEDVRLATTRLVRSINVLGYPALSMPCGFTESGLPLGLQIVGRPFEEGVILRVGTALEGATEFHTRRPPLYNSAIAR